MNYTKRLPKGWHPPHCPSPKCEHHKQLNKGFTFKKAGFYIRMVDGRRIQRFACKACHVTFSTQTFSTTYWQKLPELDRQIIMKTTGCMANRQIAEDLKVSPPTIDRHIARLGRHAILFHMKMMQGAPPPKEVVVDGFATFERSQYFPFHHQVAVEKDTDFFIHFTDSELRRGGCKTKVQKKRQQILENTYGVPDPQAVRKDMKHLLDVVFKEQTSGVVFSDAHKSYPRAIKETACEISHIVTSSKDHRDRNNNLWEVNLTDLLIRHGSANHKRETIAWSKRRQSSAERLAIFLVSRNYIKGRRAKDRSSPTPAMARGMLDRRLKVEDILEERIFRDHLELPDRWSEYYDRKVKTRALGKNCEHTLSYAR